MEREGASNGEQDEASISRTGGDDPADECEDSGETNPIAEEEESSYTRLAKIVSVSNIDKGELLDLVSMDHSAEDDEAYISAGDAAGENENNDGDFAPLFVNAVLRENLAGIPAVANIEQAANDRLTSGVGKWDGAKPRGGGWRGNLNERKEANAYHRIRTRLAAPSKGRVVRGGKGMRGALRVRPQTLYRAVMSRRAPTPRLNAYLK